MQLTTKKAFETAIRGGKQDRVFCLHQVFLLASAEFNRIAFLSISSKRSQATILLG